MVGRRLLMMALKHALVRRLNGTCKTNSWRSGWLVVCEFW